MVTKHFFEMAESKRVITDVKKESLNHEKKSTMTIDPSDLNNPLEIVTISPCTDEESITLDIVNENAESQEGLRKCQKKIQALIASHVFRKPMNPSKSYSFRIPIQTIRSLPTLFPPKVILIYLYSVM